MNKTTTDQLKLETFAPLVGSKFRVYADATGPTELELVEATEFTGHGNKPAPGTGLIQESFSVMFDGPEGCFLPQGMYVFEQDALGRIELFIVPVGRKAGLFQYQAVFNRLVQLKQ
jgi:hypothetical protein